MKSNLGDILKIENRASISRLLAEIKNESEINAKIIKRYSPREAILEIKGKRIKTEFTDKIPEKSEVILKLVNRGRNTYLFKLVDPVVKSEIITVLENISLLGPDELHSLNLPVLKKFLDRDVKDLITLNLVLMGKNDLMKNSQETLSLLRYLKSSGLDVTLLNMLSLLSANSREGIQLLFFLLSLAGFFEGISRKYFNEKEINSSRILSDILEMIDNSVDKREKGKILTKLIDLIAVKNIMTEELTAGEITFFDKDAEEKINYITYKKSWLFSLNLSNIGIIDIFAGVTGNTFEITLFAESERIVDMLKNSHNRLKNAFKAEGIKASIKYRNRGNIVDKLKGLTGKYSSENSIDVKV